MKYQNCIEVKYVSNLSVAYLTRFFGSVGPVVKVEKDEISKYVTIQFANRNSVDKAFRFDGRVLDQRAIKIKKLREIQLIEPKQKVQSQMLPKDSSWSASGEGSGSLNLNKEDIWFLIQKEIKPHLYQQNEQILLAMLIWCLIDELLNSAKHLLKFKVNIRSSYLTLELERQIIERIVRKNANITAVSEGYKKAVLEWKKKDALACFGVPYPNIQEEQSKIEAASLMTKCVATIKNYLSIRLSDIINVLNASSMCVNLQETGVEELLNINPIVSTTEQDNFIGIVENLGAKNIFYQFLNYEQPNTCVLLKDSKGLQVFHCSLRLKGCRNQQLRYSSWCNFYKGKLIKKSSANSIQAYKIQEKQKIENVNLGQEVIIFENGHFSLQSVEYQVNMLKQIEQLKGMVFYITKQMKHEKGNETKQIYQDDVEKIEEEVEQKQVVQKIQNPSEKQQSGITEIISDIIIIEIRSQNNSSFNNLKLTHYLQQYVEQSIASRGLIIASRQMAIKLAGNIIDREKENRLFEFGNKIYEQYVGEQLWRVYNKQGERKVKQLLTKYSKSKK